MENIQENINRIMTLMEIKKKKKPLKKTEPVKDDTEISEEDAVTDTASADAGATTNSGSSTKWSDVVGSQLKRGHANPIGNTKWESGLTRGAGNQLK